MNRFPLRAVAEALEARALLSAADLDQTFGGGDGKVSDDFAGGFDYANAVALQKDGKIIAVGTRADLGSGRYDRFVVARYNPDGSLDPTFSPGGQEGSGVAMKLVAGGLNYGAAVAIAPDGKIVVAGRAVVNDQLAFALLRFNADGRLDSTFSPGGPEGSGVAVTSVTPFGSGAFAVAVLSDGSILAAGEADVRDPAFQRDDFALVKYRSDGSLDDAFGGAGVVTTDLGSEFDSARAIRVLADGRILVAGSALVGFALAQYHSDGTPDASFGGGSGQVVTPVPFHGGANALAVAPDGRVFVAGVADTDERLPTLSDFAVGAYLPNGERDPSFGIGGLEGDGLVLTDFKQRDAATAIALTADGKLLVAGQQDWLYGGGFAVARYNPDGSLDQTFDEGDGKTAVDFGGGVASSMALQPDGKIIVAGSTGGNFALARLRGDPQTPPPVPVTYEAEDAAVSGGVVAANHTGFTGSGFVDYLHLSDDFIEWLVDAPAAGSHVLTFRYANGGSSARTMELKLNGAAQPSGVTFEPTGSWNTWKTVSIAVTLPIAGANAVRLTTVGQSGPNVDNLSVAAANPPPSGDVLQAEAAQLVGAVVASNHPGFTGSGFVDYLNSAGDYAEFTVNAPSAGRYALDFRYANGGAGDRPLEWRVNGRLVEDRPSFLPTGGWDQWRTAAAEVFLDAGTNLIRLTAIGSSGPNLDALTVRALGQTSLAAVPAASPFADFWDEALHRNDDDALIEI